MNKIIEKDEIIELKKIYVIGLCVRTNDKNGSSKLDIWELFAQFVADNASASIPNKISDDVYCVHTDYEGHFNGDYNAIIGCSVKSLDDIPDGMIGKIIPASKYKIFTSIGDATKNIGDAWDKIWEHDSSVLNRSYTADFELYTIEAVNPYNSKVDTYVSVY